jgi:hypothetical protein
VFEYMRGEIIHTHTNDGLSDRTFANACDVDWSRFSSKPSAFFRRSPSHDIPMDYSSRQNIFPLLNLSHGLR